MTDSIGNQIAEADSIGNQMALAETIGNRKALAETIDNCLDEAETIGNQIAETTFGDHLDRCHCVGCHHWGPVRSRCHHRQARPYLYRYVQSEQRSTFHQSV